MKKNWVRKIAAAALLLCALPLHATDFPEKPVRLIVPFPPGGTLDIVGRLVAKKLQDNWGQPVIVENRGGASGAIGTDLLAKSAPDGYTLLINSTPIVATPHLQKLPYDTLRDIAGVSQVAEIEYVLVASLKSGITSFKELVAAAKKQPGKLNYSSAGNGSGQHLFMELTKGAAGINVTHVPYKGSGPASQAVQTGEVDLTFDTSVGVIPLVKAGKVRPLLVTGAKPLEALPKVPPFESLFPGVGIEAWHGIFAPSATPAQLLSRIGEDIRKAVLAPEVAARLRELGFQPTGLPSAQFQPIVRRDLERWGKVIRENHIKAD